MTNYPVRRFICNFVDGSAEFNKTDTPPAIEYLSVMEHEEELASAREVIRILSAALQNYADLIESGWLCRDISGDHQPDWALKQFAPVVKLRDASMALTRTKGERERLGVMRC